MSLGPPGPEGEPERERAAKKARKEDAKSRKRYEKSIKRVEKENKKRKNK